MTPRPGDFFVVRTNGILGAIVRWMTQSSVNHAGVYVGTPTGFPVPQIVEAQPGGAIMSPASKFAGSIWSTDRLPASITPTQEQGEQIAREAIKLVGTEYGIGDIVAIGMAQRRLGGRVKSNVPWDEQPWWVRRLMRKDRLICSEMVDRAYQLAGVHLYSDGRLEQLVTPGDLLLTLEPQPLVNT